MDELRFDSRDLELFAAASHDLNPLHLSAEYARRSSAGEQIVYGCLALLSCIARMGPPEGTVIAHIELKFRAPHLLGVSYWFSWKQTAPDKLVGTLKDGSTTTLSFRLTLEPGDPKLAIWPDAVSAAVRQTARLLSPEDLKPDLGFQGEYLPPPNAFGDLLKHIGFERTVWGDAVAVVALCCSYLTGMEMPGERAMFTELSAKLNTAAIQSAGCRFSVSLAAFDERYSMLSTTFRLESAGRQFSEGKMMSVLRPGTALAPSTAGVVNSRMHGKIAVVFGASRGLGAAMALDLVRAGATVFGVFARSDAEAVALASAAESLPGRLVMQKGDAADVAWCGNLRQRIEQEFGRIDLLICNAAAPPVRLRIEPSSLARIDSYLLTGFNMVAAPLSVFLEPLAYQRGIIVLISSSAVTTAPGIWPQYVAMKAAVEGLLASAANEYPDAVYWIARPGRMQTDMTTPSAWAEAEPAAQASARILQNAGEKVKPGQIHYC